MRVARSRAGLVGRRLLILGSAALVLATAAALLARHWWAFDLFSHFRLQYVALGAVLLVFALVLRTVAIAVALAAVIAIHGWAMRGLWLGDRASPSGGAPLLVASANVLNSNPTPGRLVDFAKAAEPDLLFVIDAAGERWRDMLEELAQSYPHQAPKGWRDGAPVILFSRRPIVEKAARRPPFGGRPYLVAEVAIGPGSLTVVGIHPASPSPTEGADSHRRNWQLDHIAATLADAERPLLVAGDFNTTPWSPHFADLLARSGLRDAGAGQGWIGTWPAGFWPARVPIDHLLVGAGVCVASLRRGPDIGSDHFPILAELRVLAPSGSRPAPERLQPAQRPNPAPVN